MLINLFYGLSTMAVCLLLQAIPVAAALRYYGRHKGRIEDPTIGATLKVIVVVMMLLVLGNIAQITIWAGLFMALKEFSEFNEAVYHSAVNFATLGYGDIVMSDKHKLLGPLEAVNGVLMIGVSTAALMATFQDSIKTTIRAKRGEL